MTINSEQIQALKAAAEKATPGEWGIQFGDEIYASDGVNHEQIAMLFSDNSARDAEFIAAANPAAILSLLAERDADKALIAEQAKRIAELEASHKKLRGSMAAIHNTIRLDGVGVSLSVLLSASKRAYEDSAAAAGITLDMGE